MSEVIIEIIILKEKMIREDFRGIKETSKG